MRRLIIAGLISTLLVTAVTVMKAKDVAEASNARNHNVINALQQLEVK